MYAQGGRRRRRHRVCSQPVWSFWTHPDDTCLPAPCLPPAHTGIIPKPSFWVCEGLALACGRLKEEAGGEETSRYCGPGTLSLSPKRDVSSKPVLLCTPTPTPTPLSAPKHTHALISPALLGKVFKLGGRNLKQKRVDFPSADSGPNYLQRLSSVSHLKFKSGASVKSLRYFFFFFFFHPVGPRRLGAQRGTRSVRKW